MNVSDEQRLNDLLARWRQLHGASQAVSLETLCADCLHLLPELERRVRLSDTWHPADADSTPSAAGAPPASDQPVEPVTSTTEYRQLVLHAVGGLGEIYCAHDCMVRRDVALKLIRPKLFDDVDSLNRFLREAEITGRLEHPGVVPMYGVGELPDGRPFYAMRFVAGETLEQAIGRFHRPRMAGDDPRRRGLEFHRLLRQFVSAANTIAYAHNRGVVHLDIKPDNIMLGRYGETLVLDWGLAAHVGRDARARASGEATLRPSSGPGDDGSVKGVGTPSYMSPEQTPHGSGDIGPASDVYSLGATLYKLLCGQAAFRGVDAADVMAKVLRGDFPPPREFRPDVPRPLEAICLRAMQLEPAARYGTPLELASDVECYLADEPVAAYDESPLERAARWTRRHSGFARGLLLAMVLLLAASSTVALLLGRMADQERDARLLVETAREQSLMMSARFAARTVAGEIDLRWRILEAQAGRETPRALLARLADQPDDDTAQRQLQTWLETQASRHRQAATADSWFITDATGLQLARAPFSPTTNARRFAYRDYFHGQGRDLSEQTPPPPPLTEVHRSCVYQSSADGTLRVAFSVPIWNRDDDSPERHVIGVLAMTVDLGKFRVLQTGLGPRQTAVLVDTRPDEIAGESQSGLILHHPRLANVSRSPGDSAAPPRVSPSFVARLVKLRADAVDYQRHWEVARDANQPPPRWPGVLEFNYRDPVDVTDHERWLAAAEPVLVVGRAPGVMDTGWVVIVQERVE